CVIDIIIAWWIYNDAKERDNMDEKVWAIIGFFLGIIGLIIYILLRDKESTSST
ncbi:unnamed protein product, partial [marine sediment metagenome]